MLTEGHVALGLLRGTCEHVGEPVEEGAGPQGAGFSHWLLLWREEPFQTPGRGLLRPSMPLNGCKARLNFVFCLLAIQSILADTVLCVS